MKKLLVSILAVWLIHSTTLFSQARLDSLLPVRCFMIGAPSPDHLNDFLTFMKKELAPNHINTIILQVDYNYAYESYPNLRDSVVLTKKDVKEIVKTARELHIKLVPMINLLGHQSWAGHLNPLLTQYPEFDETPWVKMPEKYVWPNPDKLYCKSYCPQQPEVHKVIFALIDELMDAFETDTFHAGMDEVFYIGEDKCPRCSGMDKSRLFADEVRRIHDHLADKGRKMWMWSDRLLDGSVNGLGEWEASKNDTWRAIDWIPRDITMCDWHYEHAEPTPAYFALKGFHVLICPWRKPEVGVNELKEAVMLRQYSNPKIADKIDGICQTVWNSPEGFMNSYYDKVPEGRRKDMSAETLKALFKEFNTIAEQ